MICTQPVVRVHLVLAADGGGGGVVRYVYIYIYTL